MTLHGILNNIQESKLSTGFSPNAWDSNHTPRAPQPGWPRAQERTIDHACTTYVFRFGPGLAGDIASQIPDPIHLPSGPSRGDVFTHQAPVEQASIAPATPYIFGDAATSR